QTTSHRSRRRQPASTSPTSCPRFSRAEARRSDGGHRCHSGSAVSRQRRFGCRGLFHLICRSLLRVICLGVGRPCVCLSLRLGLAIGTRSLVSLLLGHGRFLFRRVCHGLCLGRGVSLLRDVLLRHVLLRLGFGRCGELRLYLGDLVIQELLFGSRPCQRPSCRGGAGGLQRVAGSP